MFFFKLSTGLTVINDTVCLNENTDENATNFLKPPTSSRLTTPVPRQTSASTKKSTNKDVRKSVAFSNSKSEQRHMTSPSPNNCITNKSATFTSKSNNNTNLNKKQPHWQASNRPSSAFSRISTTLVSDEIAPVENMPTNKSVLFLNYSKLVAIESNMQKELVKDLEYTRPKTANPLLPHKDQVIQHVTGSDLIENNLSIGNQEAYAYLMADTKKMQLESIKIASSNCEPIGQSVDWLTLPHEIWLNILSYLKHTDLIQFARCCKSFSNIYLDNTLCKEIFCVYFYMLFLFQSLFFYILFRENYFNEI